MKWPLSGAAMLFALGIAMGARWEVPLVVSWGMALVVGGFAAFGRRVSPWALEAALVLAGACHIAFFMRLLGPDDLTRVVMERESIVCLRGTLLSSPEERIYGRSGKFSTNTLVVLESRGYLGSGGDVWRPVSGHVLVSSAVVPGPGFTAGAEVEISGVLRRPRGPLAPGTFDHARYLHWQGIEYELRATEEGDWRWAPGAVPPAPVWADRFQRWAMRVLSIGLSAAEEETRLLWAMTLGWKTALTPEIDEPFMRSGTMHVFAISGLHIALIAGITAQVLRLLFVPRVAAGGVVIGICWLYTLATGVQPSAVRSTLMTTFVVAGMMWSRPSNVLNSLSAAALAVLVWDPRQLFQAGFQLSFAVVAALGLLGTPIHRWLAGWGAPDPMLAGSAVPWWRRQWCEKWSFLSGSLAVAAASWVGSVPLGAEHFHLLTFSGFVANLVVVPLSSCALAGNVASLACGLWAPGLSELFNHASWLFMRGMLGVSRWAAAIPGGCWNVTAPPSAATAVWYLLVVATGMGWWRSHRARALTLGAVAALSGIAGVQVWSGSDRLRLVVMPLSGGHAVWVRAADGDTLVDTGDGVSAERVVVPFLKAQGVNRLSVLALTHGDIRHVGGVSNVVSRFGIGEVRVGPVAFRSGSYRGALEECVRRGGSVKTGVGWGGSEEPWRALHPQKGDRFSKADDACLVLGCSEAGTRMVLWADLDRLGQQRLLERHPGLRADVLVLAPPGSGSPPVQALIDLVHPGLVIVADATSPATARAKEPFRAVFDGGGMQVFYTSETGSLDLRWDGRRWRVLDSAGREVTAGGSGGAGPTARREG